MLSLSLALVCNAFPAQEQPRALGIWAAVSAVALAIGPLAGGVLIEIDWRDLLDEPAGGGYRGGDYGARGAGVDRSRRRHQDRLGRARGAWRRRHRDRPRSGPGPRLGAATIVGLALVGIAALLVFARVERPVREPIVDFALFRNRPYFGASRGLRPRRRLLGGDVLPAAVSTGRARPLADRRRLADPADHRADDLRLALFGAVDRSLRCSPADDGRHGFRRRRPVAVDPESEATVRSRWSWVAYLLFGIALSLVYAPMSTAAMAATPREKVGIASGVLAMTGFSRGRLAGRDRCRLPPPAGWR
jgi:hypothetical protein